MFTTVKNAIRRYIKSTDMFLIFATIAASVYGIILVASATSGFGSHKTLIIQIGAATVGFIFMILLSLIDYDILSELWVFLFIGSLGIMLLTLLIGTGPTDSTNRNWINLGPISIQPSEFVKIAYITILASLISKFGEDLNKIKNLITIGAVALALIGSIMLTGDTGMAVVYLFITLIMLFVAGLQLRYFAILFGAAAVGVPIVWKFFMHGYQKDRVIFGFMPERDPTGIGYQATQGKTAIGSGQLMGKGLFHGSLVQSGSVPAHHTDFIFSVAGEELGFIGTLLVVVIIGILIAKILYDAKTSVTTMGSMICTGVFATLLFQTFVNILMCIGMFPIIGITLPFFSYGGSSILSSFFAIGLVLSVVYHKKTLQFDEY